MGNGPSVEYVKVLFPGGDQHFPEALSKTRAILEKQSKGVIQCMSCHTDALMEHVADCHVIVPLMTPVSRRVMEQAGYLVMIMQFGGALELVDVRAASEMGIPVSFVPSEGTGNAESAAEMAIFHIIQCLRRPHDMAQCLATRRLGHPMGRSILGSKVFIYGLGGVGRQVAARIRAFGPSSLTAVLRAGGDDCGLVDICGTATDVSRLSRNADIVVLCLDADMNEGVVDTVFLDNLARGAVLVNVACGTLLNQADVLAALNSGQLSGAGLDVFGEEPFPLVDPLLQHPACHATPHVAGATHCSYDTLAAAVCDNVMRLLDGRPLRNVVNADKVSPVQARYHAGHAAHIGV